MKKPKFKLLTEFKNFITRGNVLDLAVGMIIGAAFTAIVAALVNSIFKPLINAIPMGGVEGLITMLVPKDANGVTVAMGSSAIDLTKSVYIDWGAFIMAIINFLLTAVVLFAIIKAINTAKNLGKKSSESIKKQLEKGKITEQEAAAAQAELDAQAEPQPEPVDQTLELLREIRDLLKNQQVEAAQNKLEEIGE